MLNNKLKAVSIAKETPVATLFLQLEGEDIAQYPLVTLEEIEEGSFFSKVYDYLRLQLTAYKLSPKNNIRKASLFNEAFFVPSKITALLIFKFRILISVFS